MNNSRNIQALEYKIAKLTALIAEMVTHGVSDVKIEALRQRKLRYETQYPCCCEHTELCTFCDCFIK